MKGFTRSFVWALSLAGMLLTSCGGSGGGGGAFFAGNGNTQKEKFTTNGQVWALAIGPDGTTYIGGSFTKVYTMTGGAIPFDVTTAKPLAVFPVVKGWISSAVPDGSGGWYVGGSFTAVGGIARKNLAHIKADWTVDLAWDPSANFPVIALTRTGNVVYAGGQFTSVNSGPTLTTRNRIAAFDATTGIATAWDPNMNGDVKTLAVNGNTVYAGGTFSAVNTGPTVTRNGLAAINTITGTATSWDPNMNGGTVNALALNGSAVYAGGSFSSVNSGPSTTMRWNAAAFDATTGTATAWNPYMNNTVSALSINGSTIYLGGDFTLANTNSGATVTTRNYLAAADATTGIVSTWNPNPSASVYSLVLSGNTLYTGGTFTGVNMSSTPTARSGIAALDTTTGLPTAWDPKINSAAGALAVNGNVIYLGGAFFLGAVARNNLAALDATGVPTAWDPNVNGLVTTIAVNGNRVYAGGSFSAVNSEPTLTRHGLAAFDATTGIATAWDPNVNNTVWKLAVSGNTVYAGGAFTAVNSGPTLTRNYLAAFDGTTGTATAWNPNPNNAVYDLALNGSTVYAGGVFSTLNSAPTQTRRALAAIDAATGVATSWDPNVNGGVAAIAINGNIIYAGGSFGSVNSAPVTRHNAAAFDLATGTATAWDPDVNNIIWNLAISGNTVYAGGQFTSVNTGWSLTRNRLAAFDAATGTATSWDPNANNVVKALAVSGDTVYVGGFYNNVAFNPWVGYALISK